MTINQLKQSALKELIAQEGTSIDEYNKKIIRRLLTSHQHTLDKARLEWILKELKEQEQMSNEMWKGTFGDGFRKSINDIEIIIRKELESI